MPPFSAVESLVHPVIVRRISSSPSPPHRSLLSQHVPDTTGHDRFHYGAQALYDAVVARYSSPATASLGRLLLPYLFPELSAFATVADLVTHLRTSDARYRATIPAEFLATNQSPMFITLHFTVSRLPYSLRSIRDQFLSLDPTSLIVDLLDAKHRSSKGKGGRGGGGGSGGGGGGSGSSGGGSGGGGGGSEGGGGGWTGGGSGGSGGGDGGGGGSGGSGGGGSGGGRSGPRHGGPGGGQRQEQQRRSIAATALGASASGIAPAKGDCYRCVPPDPGLHLPLFSTNLVSTATLQDAMVTTTTPGGQPVSICTCTWTGRHLATFTHRPGSSLYTLATKPPQVAASAQVVASAQVFASGHVATSCSCRLLSHQTLLWHHRLGHPSLPRLRGMHSHFLVSGLPRSLPPLPPSPAPPCLPCVEGWQRAAPHSSLFPLTTAPLQTLHMDVWGPAHVSGQSRERYFLLVVDDYTRYTTVFPLRSKGEVVDVLIPWIRTVRLQLRERFGQDLPVLCLHSDRGVMEVACTSMIHAAAPHFLWPFAFRYDAHQLNLWPRVSLPETLPTLRWTGKVGSVEPGGAGSEGAGSGGAEPGGAEREGVEPGGAESEGAELGGTEPWAPGARGAGDTGAGGAAVPAGAGGTGGAAATGPGGARTSGARAAGTGGVGCARAGDPTEPGAAGAGGTGAGGAGGGGPGAGGAGAAKAGVGGTGAGGARLARAGAVDPSVGGAGGTVRPRPYFVPLLQQVLGVPSSNGLPPPFLCPPPDQSQLSLQPASPLPAPSPYTEQSGGLIERREPASCPVSPVGTARSRPPPVPGTHAMALCPSSVPLLPHCRLDNKYILTPLPAPLEVPDPASDRAHAATPTLSRLLATAVTNPSFESAAASAFVDELLDFAAACRLDYATALVAESVSASPPCVGGECALGTDVLEDRQEESECLAAAVPRFASMLLAPEGDPDAPDIPSPCSYAEAITGPDSSQWQAAMDAEMASWKSTATYVDEVPPSRAKIVDGMWIFRVKQPPGSPPASKARYVARGFSQRQGRDYELYSLDFITPFLQGNLHDEIWLRRPPGFTGTFPTGTYWSLRRPVYSLLQAPREWHDTLRTTLAALGFAPSTADPSLFLRTDTSLPPFYVLVYVDVLVFATADTEAMTLVKPELQKRHTCTDLGELRSYLGLQITRDRARRTITLTQSHMVHQVLQRFGFQFSSPQPTSLSTSHSLSAPPSDESVEPSGPYPELVGCLMYLMTCTRPDLAYPLSLLARYVAPGRHRKVHWDTTKRLLRYLCRTSGMGLLLGGRGPVVLTGYADASLVDDSATQRSS
ncbi:unnamed protein product [Closterium sp. NIES-54]